MRRRALACLGCFFCAIFAPLPAAAQRVVTSARPDRVAVTLYRAPRRSSDEALDLAWLDGYALVTESRRVELPAGESEIRFEGVAGGIVPQSAIVTGFPNGIVERNRDAYLLSPATLLDRSLGQRVRIRRTSGETGAVTNSDAVIRSGADGAVVIQTRTGFEALRCTGQNETLVYNSLPGGLSARPTLSVRARARRPVAATVTLAYLASNFDWQANYIANLSADGSRIDLFASLTLASGDETSFVNADMQAVAGRLNREDVDEQPREGGPLSLQCWPAATTSDIPLEQWQRMAMGRGRWLGRRGDDIDVLGVPVPAPMMSASMVTAVASVETLGDVKLYRFPERVTLASRSQKQVAFLNRTQIPVRLVYRDYFSADPVVRTGTEREPPVRLMVTRNRAAEHLGEPLPAGRVVLYGQGPDRPILLGEGGLDDRAVGEDVEVNLGPSPGVRSAFRMLSRQQDIGQFELVVTNDQSAPIAFEGVLQVDNIQAGESFGERGGWPLWRVTLPAHGRAVLCFRAPIDEYYRTDTSPGTGGTCDRISASPAAAGDSRRAPRR